MNAAQLKLELFRTIDNLDNSSLQKFYEYIVVPKKGKTDFWDELNENQRADIELGLKDLTEGKKKDFRKVLEKYNKK